jgi:predicted RNA-binding Zn-ribbon protein involved in translation (DUF1610 family)
MTVCPACGSARVFRSKSRNAFEGFRRQFTVKRPYRCHACAWRGWGADGAQVVPPEDVIDAASPPPDLSAIDAVLEESQKRSDN